MSTPFVPSGATSRRTARSGFGLIEALIGLSVATVSVLAMLWSTSVGARLQQQTAEYSTASLAITRVYEVLRNGPLADRFTEYEVAPEFADGSLQVEVRFPEQAVLDFLASSGFSGWTEETQPGGGGGPLVAVTDGIPTGWRYRDLDGDGDVELNPAATSTRSLLPVRVTVRWSSGQLRSTFLVTER
jgi:hypothetical protein